MSTVTLFALEKTVTWFQETEHTAGRIVFDPQ